MSGGGHAAPPAAGAAPAAAAGHHRDPTQEIALQLFIHLCGIIYSQGGGGAKPDPKAVVQLSFKLAEAFEHGNFEFNPVARAAREAKEKASVNLDAVQVDFASFAKPK